MLLYQLSRLKTDERLQNDGYYTVGVNLINTQNRYITVLNNTKTTFNNLIEVYDSYIQRVLINLLLPNTTYAHVYYLKEFNTLLQTEELPDEIPTNIHAMMAGMSLDELLVMLYDNIGADVTRFQYEDFSTGNMEAVKDDLTYELYTNLSQKLLKLEGMTNM